MSGESEKTLRETFEEAKVRSCFLFRKAVQYGSQVTMLIIDYFSVIFAARSAFAIIY